MKTVVIPDLHGKSMWLMVIEKERPQRVIFLGDYFDSFDISGAEQVRNFQKLMEYAEKHPEIEWVFLIGNHDYHYFLEVGYTGTSGYQGDMAATIGHLLEANKDKLQMAYQMDQYLFSHAGVGETFLRRNEFYKANLPIVDFVNELWNNNKQAFDFCGVDGYGDDIGQTPIWIRPKSLMQDGDLEYTNQHVQVVGHTRVLSLSDQLEENEDTPFIFCDTWDNAVKHYLVLEDGKRMSRSF